MLEKEIREKKKFIQDNLKLLETCITELENIYQLDLTKIPLKAIWAVSHKTLGPSQDIVGLTQKILETHKELSFYGLEIKELPDWFHKKAVYLNKKTRHYVQIRDNSFVGHREKILQCLDNRYSGNRRKNLELADASYEWLIDHGGLHLEDTDEEGQEELKAALKQDANDDKIRLAQKRLKFSSYELSKKLAKKELEKMKDELRKLAKDPKNWRELTVAETRKFLGLSITALSHRMAPSANWPAREFVKRVDGNRGINTRYRVLEVLEDRNSPKTNIYNIKLVEPSGRRLEDL